ncbi:MAG: toll/interleukin-1 receptor domain-containing protein [Verrucomicrobiales bacterium]|nr:toll/interleukin-1 receptor domain-containing protein [Verrucomicrobiales bacterium]
MKIFLSYRRDDYIVAGSIRHIYSRLEEHFGRGKVFIDIDNIRLGSDFRKVLRDEVAKADVLIAAIGPQWLSLLQERESSPPDYVKTEIESAFDQEITVVPLLVGNTQMPKQGDLPESLEFFSFNQYSNLDPGKNFENDILLLITELKKLTLSDKGEQSIDKKTKDEIRQPSKTAKSEDSTIQKSTEVSQPRSKSIHRFIVVVGSALAAAIVLFFNQSNWRLLNTAEGPAERVITQLKVSRSNYVDTPEPIEPRNGATGKTPALTMPTNSGNEGSTVDQRNTAPASTETEKEVVRLAPIANLEVPTEEETKAAALKAKKEKQKEEIEKLKVQKMADAKSAHLELIHKNRVNETYSFESADVTVLLDQTEFIPSASTLKTFLDQFRRYWTEQTWNGGNIINDVSINDDHEIVETSVSYTVVLQNGFDKLSGAVVEKAQWRFEDELVPRIIHYSSQTAPSFDRIIDGRSVWAVPEKDEITELKKKKISEQLSAFITTESEIDDENVTNFLDFFHFQKDGMVDYYGSSESRRQITSSISDQLDKYSSRNFTLIGKPLIRNSGGDDSDQFEVFYGIGYNHQKISGDSDKVNGINLQRAIFDFSNGPPKILSIAVMGSVKDVDGTIDQSILVTTKINEAGYSNVRYSAEIESAENKLFSIENGSKCHLWKKEAESKLSGWFFVVDVENQYPGFVSGDQFDKELPGARKSTPSSKPKGRLFNNLFNRR